VTVVARRSVAAVLLAAACLAAAAAPAAGAPAEGTLLTYVSSASWPVRASALRVHTVADRIDGWLNQGDPPYLGQIAGACRNVLALRSDTRGTLAALTPPAPLQRAHVRLSRAYATVAAGCATARQLALRARDAVDHAASFRDPGTLSEWQRARSYMRAFAPTLRSFAAAVFRWRVDVLAGYSALGAPPPRWVRELG
jgi:hypothetical protein